MFLQNLNLLFGITDAFICRYDFPHWLFNCALQIKLVFFVVNEAFRALICQTAGKFLI